MTSKVVLLWRKALQQRKKSPLKTNTGRSLTVWTWIWRYQQSTEALKQTKKWWLTQEMRSHLRSCSNYCVLHTTNRINEKGSESHHKTKRTWQALQQTRSYLPRLRIDKQIWVWKGIQGRQVSKTGQCRITAQGPGWW